MNIESLKYPIGKFEKSSEITQSLINTWIKDIEAFPDKLKHEVQNLSQEQLDTPYRPDGWTIRQVVHHVADSHMNSFIRIKLALTEDNPVIKPYLEAKWAELPDTKNYPVQISLNIIQALHERWGYLLKALTEEELDRTFIHPESNKEFTIKEMIGFYAWHSNHHLAHITSIKKAKNW